MKSKKLLSLLMCLSGVCALAGCEDETQTNPDPTPNTVVEPTPDPEPEPEPEPEPDENDIDVKLQEIKINSLLDGMVALYQTKNYTLDVIHTFGSYREEIPNMIFTKKYIGYDSNMYEDLNVFYNDGNGIYRVSYGDDFLSSEYLTDKDGKKYTNLWDNSVINTMYGACGYYIKANVSKEINEINITDKEYKINFLKTIVGNTDNYTNIDLNAKYENGKVVFNLSVSGGAHLYKVTLRKVGITKSEHLKMFTANEGKPFVPSHELSEMRRLLKLDNYVQRTYMINEGQGYWGGYQFFTEHYFYQTGNDYSVGNAYMEFDYKEDPTIANDFDMWGIYMVNVSKDINGQPVASLVSNQAYNSSTIEIEECVRYPSRKLDLLKSLEYVKAGEIRDAQYDKSEGMFENETSKYYFVEESLVKNFVNNFGLDTAFENVVFSTVAFEIELAEQDKDSKVCFHAIGYYAGDGLTYDILLPLYGFGDANRTYLDNLYSMYNNKSN